NGRNRMDIDSCSRSGIVIYAAGEAFSLHKRSEDFQGRVLLRFLSLYYSAELHTWVDHIRLSGICQNKYRSIPIQPDRALAHMATDNILSFHTRPIHILVSSVAA